MKEFKGFKSEAPATKFPMLPAGTYVAGITAVKIDGIEPDQQLVLRLDIIDGEFTGYFKKRYDHDSNTAGFNQQFQAKYKGDFKIQIPNEDNTRRNHYDWDVKGFNNAIYCIEQSNSGYHWDWDEKKLKGKIVGINVREGSYNGNPYTQIGRLEVADDVRKGIVQTMKPKAARGDADDSGISVTASNPAGFFTPVEEEVPF